MKVTVCELNEDRTLFNRDWEWLAEHVRTEGSDLVLLPEFPFSEWFPVTPDYSDKTWTQAVLAHDAWIQRLGELAPAAVLSSRPVNHAARRLDEGFVWDRQLGYRPAHLKHYVPDVDGWWEASWFQPAEADFSPGDVGTALVGFQICTEIWAMGRAQSYGKRGVHLIVTPRATETASLDKFLAGGRVAALVSGGFVLSSNRVGNTAGKATFGGQGWVIGPDGDVLALTSAEHPFVTVAIDLAAADRAKSTYPRDVLE